MRASRTRDPTQFVDGRLDRGTLDEVDEIVAALAQLSPEAAAARPRLQALRAACDRAGHLPSSRRDELAWFLGQLEARLA